MRYRVIFWIYNIPGRTKACRVIWAVIYKMLEMLNRQPSFAEVWESASVNMIFFNKASTTRFKHFLYYIIFKFIFTIHGILWCRLWLYLYWSFPIYFVEVCRISMLFQSYCSTKLWINYKFTLGRYKYIIVFNLDQFAWMFGFFSFILLRLLGVILHYFEAGLELNWMCE